MLGRGVAHVLTTSSPSALFSGEAVAAFGEGDLAFDFGSEALLDTFDHLTAAGIQWVGAGPDIERARQPVVLQAAGLRLAIVAFTDHPAEYAAGRGRPGVAYANLRHDTPGWLIDTVRSAATEADAVLVSPHWGPNMLASPLPYVRRAAHELRGAG